VTRGFLFDLDGTLVDSERETAEAMARALLKGQEIVVEQYDKDFIIGRSWVAIYESLRDTYRCLYDEGATVGKRYARMDEVGMPYGITVDSQSLVDGTVTVRDRDTTQQDRVHQHELLGYLGERMRSWKRADDASL